MRYKTLTLRELLNSKNQIVKRKAKKILEQLKKNNS